ncbi:ATP-binding protein [Thiomicrorhabdus sp. ZW0627]|uniref:AAA family ATPase n=1 Tax=Thiomicrorhabdus sp. ZW0627 TaxID=3039774 RepID=UPI00243657AB|nr:ATP-binding protein [Thiomicrorhabdus sp. ZW0627]MDG6774668.1 ATP-binding protein [Thiomicrorhabdus sp. ZW0627]
MQVGTLILFSGKMGAGKSTKSKQVSQKRNAVLISEDEWLSKLYPNQITSFEDYIRYSSLLKPLIKSHVLEILKTGTNVVMDFPANTVNQRKWFKDLINEANASNELIYLNVSNDVCLKQLEKRRLEQPERAIFDTETMFIEVSKYFQEPDQSEGFNLKIIEQNT